MKRNFAEEDINKIAKGTGATLVGSSIGRGIFFLSQLIIARVLGAEAFGLYALGFAAAKIGETFARMGLNNGGMRFVSIYKGEDPRKLKGAIISASGISFFGGFAVGLLLWFSAGFLAQYVFQKPVLTNTLKWFAVSLPFLTAMTVVTSLLQGFHTTKYTVYAREFIQPGINIVLVLVFYYAGLGLEGMVYAFVVSHAVALFAGVYFFTKLFPGCFSQAIRPIYQLGSLLSYSIPLLFVGFLHIFLSYTDTLMLGLWGTARDVGIYRAATQVPLVMTLFLSATNSIYAPLVADLYQQSEMQRLVTVFKTTTRWISYATIPLFILFVFSAKEIMMIFGKEYVETGSTVLIILSFRQLVSCVSGGVGITLTMTYRQKLELLNSISMVIINIVLNYVLIPKFGAIGAAVSSAISVICINLLRLIEIEFLYKINPFSPAVLKYLIPSVISIGIFIVLSRIDISVQYMLMLSIKICIIIITFGLFFGVGNNITEEDYFIYRKISKAIKRA